MSSPSQGITLSGFRVLIAEDDTNLAKLLGRQLEELEEKVDKDDELEIKAVTIRKD